MATPDRVFDGEEMLCVLAAHRVDFVVIGGIAVQAHGYIRATKHLDIVVRPTTLILTRVSEALSELEGELCGSGAYSTKHGPLGVVDIEKLAGAPPSYEALRERALVIALPSLVDIEALTRDAEST
jgi:hypothetical protein